jgi:hypothetical protein
MINTNKRHYSSVIFDKLSEGYYFIQPTNSTSDINLHEIIFCKGTKFLKNFSSNFNHPKNIKNMRIIEI